MPNDSMIQFFCHFHTPKNLKFACCLERFHLQVVPDLMKYVPFTSNWTHQGLNYPFPRVLLKSCGKLYETSCDWWFGGVWVERFVMAGVHIRKKPNNTKSNHLSGTCVDHYDHWDCDLQIVTSKLACDLSGKACGMLGPKSWI